MANRLIQPGSIYIGTDALQEALPEIAGLGRRALLVTGASMERQGLLQKFCSDLLRFGTETVVFSGITGEPTDRMVVDGVARYRAEQCDMLIAFGGGSPIDAAKAIGAMATNPGTITDYNGKPIPNPIPPMAAIPTTAGTGSEVTQVTIITDTERNIKMLLKGTGLVPRIAVVDPVFSRSMPPAVTAATGLDALTHAVEAFASRKAFDQTDIYARSAVKRIFRALPRAFADGSDTEAREQVAMAALEAGIAFGNASVTLVHGMSRPIGALFHVPHGLSNAMLLEVCLPFMAGGAGERFAVLGREIGAASEQDPEEMATRKFLDAVRQLCRICQVPTPAEYGISREIFFDKIDKMAGDALASGSPALTRRPVSKEEIAELYRALWNVDR